MKIVPMTDDTWRIEDEGVRFFLLAGEKKALLIDSGMTVHNAREIAQELVSVPVELLNTHADPDHIGSNAEFEKFYLHPAEASNYYNTQKRTGEWIPVEEGDVLDLGGRKLEVISIPGHTPGSIALLERERRILYGGDTVQDGTIFMFGVQRELHAYLWSLRKLEKRCDCFDWIYPSHGSIPVTKDLIGKLYQAGRAILAGEAEASEACFHGLALKRYDMGCASFLCE